MIKKILIVASPWLGGSGTVAFELSQELSKKGYEVHFVSYKNAFRTKHHKGVIIFHKVVGFRYPLFPFRLYELALADEIVKVVLKENIEIIHAHYGILFGHAAILAKSILKSLGKNIKVVVTFHGSDVLGFDIKRPGEVAPQYINKWAIRTADSVTVASYNLKQDLLNLYGVKRPVVIIPNFFDASIFTASEKNFQKPVLLHISNLRKIKQPLAVVKIFELILKDFPKTKLILIGKGPETKRIKEYIKQKQISNISLVGAVRSEERLAGYYKQANIFLLPSLYENFPLVALEAQASGIPVVASNAGGIPEVVIDGRSGLLADPLNITAHAQNVKKLLSDEKLWNAMRKEAEKVVAQYQNAKIIKQYIELYNSL